MIITFVILFFISVGGIISDVQGSDSLFPTSDVIFEVIEHDDAQRAKQMIENNILRINESFGVDGRTALHVAVFNRSKQVVEMLLAYGAHPHITDYFGKTAVYYSADALALIEKNAELDHDEKMKAYSIFELLIRYSTQVDRNKHGNTIIHLLSGIDDTDVINQYLEKVVKNNYYHKAINYQNYNYYTPLHCAVDAGNIEAVKILLRHGACIDVGMKYDITPIHRAAKHNDGDIMQEFLGQMKMKRWNSVKMRVLGWADTTQVTPLHTAASCGSTDVAQLLLKEGPKINAYDADGQTALHYAAKNKFDNMVLLLIKNGAHCNASNNKSQTPLHYAAFYRISENIKYLVKHGASVNATDIRGCTPLLLSVRQRYTRVSDPRPNHDTSNMLRTMHTLYSLGADPMIRSERYDSIIECAVQTGLWVFLHALLLYYSYLQEDKKCIPIEQMVTNYLPVDLLEFMKKYQVRWGSLKRFNRTAQVDELLMSSTPEIIEQFFNSLIPLQ